MAITRAQQVRQMLEDGGMLVSPSTTGKRPGYRRSKYDSTGGGLASSSKSKDISPGPDRDGPSKPTGGDGILNEIKKANENLNTALSKRYLKRNIDYVGGGRKLSPVIVEMLKGRKFKDSDYLGLGDASPLRLKTQFGDELIGTDDEERVRDMSDLLGQDVITRDELEPFLPKPPEDIGGEGGMSNYERRLLELEQALKAQAVTPVQTPFAPNLRLLADGGKADDGRIGFRIGSDSGKDTSGRDYGASTAAAASVSSSPSRNGGGDGPSGPPTNVGGGGITTQISKKNIPTPNTDISKFNVKDLINLGLVDLEDENTQVAELFGEQKLKDIGAIEKGFFGNKLTDKGKVLEAFRNTATNFNKSTQNTANTPQAALNFMQNKPGLFSDVLDNQEFIQSAIDQGFLGNPNDYKNQKALDTFSTGGRAGLAEGGMMSPEGGIMDLESGRQMYFLGKLVKKATRAVKKIVKSPIGKAALFASPLLMSSAARSGLASFLFKNPMAKGSGFGGFMEMLRGGMTGGGKFALGAGLTLAPFLFGNEEEKQQPMYQGADIADPNFIMANYPQFTNPRLAAEGGLMRAAYQEGSKEPVAKKTMPLLDMDGKEMDLREEGGFVPIGRMEKADDVPARLSKNEFVFTADAVRNAGDGNVDKGAEVMYNMMKNLESGGDVSEESQGLEGAREMFQTSQRLEEVL